MSYADRILFIHGDRCEIFIRFSHATKLNLWEIFSDHSRTDAWANTPKSRVTHFAEPSVLNWLFTIYHKVSEISVRMQMVRLFWCSRPEIFQNFWNVLKGVPKFPTGISERKMCLPFWIFTSSKPYSSFDACHVSFSRGCANGTRQSWSQFFIGDFRLPFLQTVDQPVFPSKW